MEQSSLYNPGFVGAQFNWWLGQVADSRTWRDNMNNSPFDNAEDIPGWGYRYKVRIMGLHDGGESVIPSDQLPWCQVMSSVWGGGQGGSFQTPGIKEGMFVFGFFLDGSDEQVPIIMGVLGNNAKTVIKGINSKVGVDTVTDESSVFEPRSGFSDDGTTPICDAQLNKGPRSAPTIESLDGVIRNTIADVIQVDIQNEKHPVECPKTKNSLTSLNTHMENFQNEYQRLLERVNSYPTAAASKDINESLDKLIKKTAGFSAKSMLTTINNTQTFLTEKLNDATMILEQEGNITNRLNILEKNIEGQGKLACVFSKIKGDLANLLEAAMKKNLDNKPSSGSPPEGTYIPTNPCETEGIVADVMVDTINQISNGYMSAINTIAAGSGEKSLGKLGSALNKLSGISIPTELDLASRLPSFNQSLDVGALSDIGGLISKLPLGGAGIGGFGAAQDLNFDMALASTFVSSVAAFLECDEPEECPPTDTLTLAGDQSNQGQINPVSTDNLSKLTSDKLQDKLEGIPKIGDKITLSDGTEGIVKNVRELSDGVGVGTTDNIVVEQVAPDIVGNFVTPPSDVAARRNMIQNKIAENNSIIARNDKLIDDIDKEFQSVSMLATTLRSLYAREAKYKAEDDRKKLAGIKIKIAFYEKALQLKGIPLDTQGFTVNPESAQRLTKLKKAKEDAINQTARLENENIELKKEFDSLTNK